MNKSHYSFQRGPVHNPSLVGKQGNIKQLGGDFIFGPGQSPTYLLRRYSIDLFLSGNSCSFASRMQNTEDRAFPCNANNANTQSLDRYRSGRSHEGGRSDLSLTIFPAVKYPYSINLFLQISNSVTLNFLPVLCSYPLVHNQSSWPDATVLQE